MKKIALFLMVLASLVVIVGCNSRKSVVRFTPEGQVSKEATAPETVIKIQKEEAPVADVEPIDLDGDKEVASPAPKVEFAVTSLEKNLSQKTKSYHVIEGTTPAETAKVLVNDYPLGKYKAGETKWSYIAAVSLGNLKAGENRFTVKAVDEDDKELGSKTFTITYAGRETAALASTGPSSLALSALISLLVAGFLVFRPKGRTV